MQELQEQHVDISAETMQQALQNMIHIYVCVCSYEKYEYVVIEQWNRDLC